MRVLSASWLARFTRSLGDRLPECTRLRTRSDILSTRSLAASGDLRRALRTLCMATSRGREYRSLFQCHAVSLFRGSARLD
jgi:hypothetical protein